MTVKIEIAAQAAQAQQAFEGIRAALRAAAQEGKAFAAIDLGHPELAKLAADLQTIQARFEQIRQTTRGETGQTVRATGAADFLSWYERHETVTGDPVAAAQHRATVGAYVLQGTSYYTPGATPAAAQTSPGQGGSVSLPPAAPSAPPPNPWAGGYINPYLQGANAPPTPQPPGGDGPTGGAGNVASSMIGPIKRALAFAGIEDIERMAKRAVGSAEDEAIGDDKLMRHLSGLGTDFEGLRDAVRETASSLRLTYGETQRLASSFSSIRGSVSQGQVLEAVKFSAGFARGYGMDPGSMVNASAKMANAGVDDRRFAALLSDTIQEGQMGGQVKQTMQTIVRWTETQSRITGSAPNIEMYTGLYSLLNASGQPGIRGEGAANILDKIDSSVRDGGGGGLASDALDYRAFYRAGITNPYEIEYRKEEGAFGGTGPDGKGKSNFEIIRDEANIEYAGVDPYQRSYQLARHFRLNAHQFNAFEQAKADGLGPEAGISFLGKRGIDLRKMDSSAYPEIFQTLDMTGPALEQERLKLANNPEMKTGADALAGKSGDELKEGLVRLLGAHGMSQTVGSEASDSVNKFENALTKDGSGLLPAINVVRDAFSMLSNQVIGPVSTALGDFMQSLRDAAAGAIGDMKTTGAVDQTKPFPGLHGVFSVGVAGPSRGDQSGDLLPAQRVHAMEMGKYLEDQGEDNAHASAFVARMIAETGLNPKADITDTDGKNRYGLLMWDTYRQARFKEFAGKDIRDSTEQEQMKFAIHEVRVGSEKAKGGRFLSAHTAFEAGQAYSKDIIRPANEAANAATTGDTAEGLSHMLPPDAVRQPAAAPPDQAVRITVDPVEVHVKHPNGQTDVHHLPATVSGKPAPFHRTKPPSLSPVSPAALAASGNDSKGF